MDMDGLEMEIAKPLPALPVETRKALVNRLLQLGVECCDDLNLINEQDLCSVLKPIQARKLVAYFTNKCKSFDVYYTTSVGKVLLKMSQKWFILSINVHKFSNIHKQSWQ